MAGCKLGCDPEYVVLVTDRCGSPTITELQYSQLQWGRILDDISDAQIDIPAGADCTGKLGGLRPWRHEVHIIRNGDEVWSGPIVTPVACKTGFTLIAADFFAWLSVRAIRVDNCFDPECGGEAEYAVRVAAKLIRDGLEPDDPCLLDFLQAIGRGPLQERNYQANTKYVIDALKDIAQGGIDFTAIGRRLVVMPEGYRLGGTSLLTCKDFLSNVCVTEDGYGASTRAIVTGKAADGTTVISGSAGGVDPYYGLIETITNDDSIRNVTSAKSQAEGLLRPPPLLVQPPQGSALSPDAPVCINDLVPGVTVPVTLDCTARSATQLQRLIKLEVTVDSTGEKVRPQLQPVGTALE